MDCKEHTPNVTLTVVAKVEAQAEIEACRKLCQEKGLQLRVRIYEDS